jgi:hypothetical protein
MRDELIVIIIALLKNFLVTIRDLEDDIKILTKYLTKHYNILEQNKQII